MDQWTKWTRVCVCVYNQPAARFLYVEACTNDQRRAVLDAVAVNGVWAGRETGVHSSPHHHNTFS